MQVSVLSLTTLADSSVVQVARFFDTQTAPDTLIESYESELFFLVHRRYHYPPDDIHVQLNRRNWLNPDTPVDYDPLAADPDYLVVGPAGEEGRLSTRCWRRERSVRSLRLRATKCMSGYVTSLGSCPQWMVSVQMWPTGYYAPEADSYLLNNDPDSWLPPSVWEWTGRRIRRRMRWPLGEDACGWWSCRPS